VFVHSQNIIRTLCSFIKIATEGLEKFDQKWEIMFTGTSIANIQAAVQTGMGLSILPGGGIEGGVKNYLPTEFTGIAYVLNSAYHS